MSVGKWVAALAALWTVPAGAEWYRATTPHFIVYAQGSAASVEATARQLEQFDAALRRIQHVGDPAEAHANPVTVYVAPTVGAVQRLCGGCSGVYGFYRASASGSVAFTPRAAPSNGGGASLTPRLVLLHEYAHHFLLGTYPIAFPAWFSEGYAEFVATATFDDEAVLIGSAANHRGYDLFNGNSLSTSALFATTTSRKTSNDIAALYAQGWLLTHYLTFDQARGRQFDDYLKRLNRGEPSLEAATAAFGDLRLLDRDLRRYLGKNRLTGLRVLLSTLPVGKVGVRALTPGEEAMIGLRMDSDAGVDAKEAKQVYTRAAGIAARFPDDATVQGWFAEMAFDNGQNDAADIAAGRALAIDPKSVQALLYRARVHLRRAAAAKDPAAFAEARSWIIKANRADSNNAEALLLFYESFLQAGETPRKSAVAGLDRAMQLVPQDSYVRFVLARQAIDDGDADLARQALRPLAYAAHADGETALAGRMLALVDSGAKGKAALEAFDAESERLAAAAAKPAGTK